VSFSTKIYESNDECITIDEKFQWPLGSEINADEVLRLQLIGHNRYLSNKIIGNYGLVLQKLVEDGVLKVNDCFTDINNMPIPISIHFDICYIPPEKKTLDNPVDQSAVEIPEGDSETQQLYPKSPVRKKDSTSGKSSSIPATVKSLANIIRLGKSRTDSQEEKMGLTKSGNGNLNEYGSTLTSGSSYNDVLVPIDYDLSPNMQSETPSLTMSTQEGEEVGPYSITKPVLVKRLDEVQESIPSNLKPQDYQVCVTIIEARHLAGLNMDPVICVQVGDQKKFTSVKESTNCPYYNEYFVFDFHMAPSMLFDKIITITVLHSRNILRPGKVIGSFKLDVGTVFAQVDHQFFHKWALLTDPDDVFSGAKGYVKCDILVAGKGDNLKPPPSKSPGDEDDIEGNLLLPKGVSAERQHAKFIIKIYRADGLPRFNAGLVSNVKKAFASQSRHLIDPYVVVTFAGLTAKTSVRKNCCNPAWNEQIVFTDMFPLLCQRIKIQIRDSDPVNDNVIATHFINLSSISNDGEKGFLPTFGPSFIYLYGSSKDFSSVLFGDQSQLNDGFCEGVSYRGRILISIATQILDSIDNNLADISVEPILPINELAFGRNEEFLLFATIFESNMIDRKYGEKLISYEITIGNDGSVDENPSDYLDIAEESSVSEREEKVSLIPVSPLLRSNHEMRSRTNSFRPMISDRQYYHLPIEQEKPCLYVKSTWPDYRRRLYNSNIITRIAYNLEIGLKDVEEMVRLERPHCDRRFRGVLEELAMGCNGYTSIAKVSTGTPAGKTKLDKERLRLCQRELEQIACQAKAMKPLITSINIKEKLKIAYQFLHMIRALSEDGLNNGLPDIFVWMIASGKRIAYSRLSSKNYIFSLVEEERGKHCMKVHNLFLKLPGKNTWVIQNKLQIYVWFGLMKHKKYFPKGLPKGYKMCDEIRQAEKIGLMPPINLVYVEKHTFQFRAHMYQARSLIGSDSSGLSDPFAKVIFADYCQMTQVIEETLSPTWDEMLIFPQVTLFGNRIDILNDPPTVVIEIYDQDKVGKSEFIGRSFAKCYIRFADQFYCVPSLEWFDIWRGDDQAGQLLAAFELLQFEDKTKNESEYPYLLPDPKISTVAILGPAGSGDRCSLYPVPPSIRPTLSKYRIEVLFWGLRDLKRVHFMSVDRPRVDIECSGHILSSSIILNYKRNSNFQIPIKHMDLELPDQELYCPPLTIRVMDCRSFGRFTLVGTHVIASLSKYIYKGIKDTAKNSNALKFQDIYISAQSILPNEAFTAKIHKNNQNKRKKKLEESAILLSIDDEDDNIDWWSRYFASLDAMISEKQQLVQEMEQMMSSYCTDEEQIMNGARKRSRSGTPKSVSPKSKAGSSPSRIATQAKRMQLPNQMLIKIYPYELENAEEFGLFSDWLNSFELYRGKRSSGEQDDQSRLVGIFKGSIQLYRYPFPEKNLFETTPNNEPIHVLVRIYIVKGNDLHPQDLNGKADPYIVINLGSKRISDKENYISKQLNPIFGKCFELEATFPQDSLLSIQVYDWDLFGTDDLIGETKIDLENRFYSRHRATCGLPRVYETSGPNQWRDSMKPTQILSKLCKDLKISGPQVNRNKIKIGNVSYVFTFNKPNNMMSPPSDDPPPPYSSSCPVLSEEQMALGVLRNWHKVFNYSLVPEHIETRGLYHPDRPGIEQGQLEMWIDMFPMDMPQPPPPIDISPRKPKSYELRIIIWNTEDVVLEDDAFFTGEKMSDIYVKGWLKGPEDAQCTDIHYRSLTGEGNFNWRFIFPFDYLPAEEKIVISRKESLFSWDETECKIPARLHLQVWDADHFSADDFLGAITLDLNRFPRGAKSSKLCTLDMLKHCDYNGSAPLISLFKQRRVKGWWPFYVKKENDEMELTVRHFLFSDLFSLQLFRRFQGKVEAEMQLLTKEEAERNPVGHGRNEPDPLEKPNRPDSSFLWVLNPLKSMRYIIWHQYKWLIVKGILFLLMVLFLAFFFYSIPGYTVKKILGA
ncbi:otoferlin-like isoform X3, partial [Dinothrombium tinctorium]